MSEYPLTYSDIQCDRCFEWFRLDGDLIDHRDAYHAALTPDGQESDRG